MKKICKLLAVSWILLLGCESLRAELPEVCSPQWLKIFFDKSGGALNTMGGRFYNFMCLHCGEFNRYYGNPWKNRTVIWDPQRPDEFKCLKCGKITTKDTCPPVSVQYAYGRQFESHRPMNKKGGRYLLFPNLRRTKAEYAFQKVICPMAQKAADARDPKLAAKALRGLVAFAEYYKSYMYDVRTVDSGGMKHTLIVRFGHPLNATYGRIWRFGDGGTTRAFCNAFNNIRQTGVKVSPRDYATCRAMAESALSDIGLPCLRDRLGLGNAMTRIYSDGINAARTFPDAKFMDRDERDRTRRILSSDDLIHELFFGRHSLSALVDNYYTPDGFMRERSPEYHSMSQNGLKAAIGYFKGYRTPENYNPEKRGYRRIAKDLDSYPNIARSLKILQEITFPDGTSIPLTDSAGNFDRNARPPQTTTIHPGWGVGILRKGKAPALSCAALSWGASAVGHGHNDLLQIMFWSDNRIMLNDTEYPHGKHRKYSADSPASHNCVLIDGADYRWIDAQEFSFYGESPLAGVMQAYTQQVYDNPGKTIRRTVVLVDSRPGKHPYLVDLAEATGGKTYDIFIRGQANFLDLPESLKVLSPAMKPAGEPGKTLDQVLGYGEKGKGAYYLVDSISAGDADGGNAELLWTFPASPKGLHKTASSLRGILVADGKEQILTGTAKDGRRTLDENKTITMALRHREFQSPRNTRFFAVYEAVPDGGKPDLKQVRLLPGSRGVVVTHSAGEDLILIPEGAEKAEFSFAGKQGTFDGQALILSRGKTVRATAIGGTELAYAGKQHRTQPAIRGEVTDYPAGLAEFSGDESNAVITVSATIPASDVGNWMGIKNKYCPAIPWKIEKVEPLAGGKTRVTLDRAARRGIFLPVQTSDPQELDSACEVFLQRGVHCKWGNQWRRVLFSMPYPPGTFIRRYVVRKLLLDEPFDITPEMRNKKVIVSNIGKGDSFVIYHTKEWTL